MEIQTVKEKIKNIKTAIKVKAAEARGLREKIAVEEVSSIKDDRKIRSLKKELNELKIEISENLRLALVDAEEALKLAEKEEKEKIKLAPKQEAVVLKWRKKSKELFTTLKQAKKENDELRLLQSAYNGMEKETGIKLDLKGVSSGFSSIDPLVDTLKDEVAGNGRKFFRYPANFPV